MTRTLVNCVRRPSRRFALVLSCRRGDAAQARGLADHPRTGDPRAQGRRSGGARQAGVAARGVRRDPGAGGTGRDPAARRRAGAGAHRPQARRHLPARSPAQRDAGDVGHRHHGKIVDERHIMYDVSDTDREAFRRSEEEGAHFTVFENCPIVEHHKGETRVVGPRLGRVHADPLDARAHRHAVQRHRRCRASPSTKRSRRTPRSCARCWERSSIRCADRSVTARRRPRNRRAAAWSPRRSSMLAKDPAMGGKQIAAKLDISLSRLARVFKAEMGMSLVEYRNRLRLDRFVVLLDRGAHEPARGGAGGGLRQLRAVPPRVPRAPPHDAARVPAQPQLTVEMRTGFRSCDRSSRGRAVDAASSTAAAHRPRAAAAHRAQRQHRSAGRSVRVGRGVGRACRFRRAAACRVRAGRPATSPCSTGPASRPPCSYTFDDTNSSQIQNYPALQALGVPMTFYLITSKTTELNNAVWTQALADGHELGSHTPHATR